MNTRLVSAASALALLLATPVLAAAPAVVHVSAPDTLVISQRGKGVAHVKLVIDTGYHVQANPVENPSLIPITLKIDPAAGVTVGRPVYPTAKRIRLPGDDHDLVVYDGEFTIALPVQLTSDFAPGDTVALNGSLRYQACDERHCLFPVTVPLTLALRVRGP